MPSDKYGKYVDARDLPPHCRKPPYCGTSVWRGRVDVWTVEAVRIKGDPLIHAVCHHMFAGIAHAERIAATGSAEVIAWVRAQPTVIAEPASSRPMNAEKS